MRSHLPLQHRGEICIGIDRMQNLNGTRLTELKYSIVGMHMANSDLLLRAIRIELTTQLASIRGTCGNDH